MARAKKNWLRNLATESYTRRRMNWYEQLVQLNKKSTFLIELTFECFVTHDALENQSKMFILGTHLDLNKRQKTVIKLNLSEQTKN